MTSSGQPQPPATGSSVVLERLRVAAGAGVRISSATEDLERHSVGFASSHAMGQPLAVAYPRTADDVSRILRFCHADRLPVIPQGGLTGLVGAGFALGGELILSTDRMREIEEVDVAASAMIVQAGVPLQRVQEEAQKHALCFPLDFGARGSSQIGGVLATDAGGNRVLKYGMARELTLGLEAVLADGTIVSSMGRMLKNNTGYDLKQLFIGSEGTLGVITRAVLRLYPEPGHTSVVLCAARTYQDVLQLLSLVRSTLGSDLSAFEVMWNDFYTAALSIRSQAPLPPTQAFYVLIEAQGGTGEAEESALETTAIGRAYEQGVIEDAVLAKSETERNGLWAIRDSSSELERIFGSCVTFDVSVPVGAIETFIDECRLRLAESVPGARALIWGHIADSNIHLACRTDAGVQPKYEISRAVYDCVGRYSGAVSAEHGIGYDKKSYLSLSRSQSEIRLMRTIKQALDPRGILNPGKLLPD